MTKKKIDEKKPRVITYSANFVGTTEEIHISTDSNGVLNMRTKSGQIPLYDKAMWVGYERPKGEKKLNYFTDALTNNPNRELEIKYNQIYGVDTNSKLYNNRLHVLSVLTKCEIINAHDQGGEVSCKIRQVMSWEYETQQENLEQQAWWFACEYILKECAIFSNPQIALVTDCDLGNILRYNKRELPIVEDKFLPPQIQLVYGSADSGKEFIPNAIISYTDKKATEYLNMKIKGNLSPSLSKRDLNGTGDD